MYQKELLKTQNINTFIDKNVVIEDNVKILFNSVILGESKIKKGTIIGPNAVIINSVIGENTIVLSSWIVDSVVGNNCQIGPYANLRKENFLFDNIRIGNFVEIKNAIINHHSKASHLSYIGDCVMGQHCNFGCGSITVNFDGKEKHQTIIGNEVFVGCNSNLVAPIKIEDNAFIACGSTITKNVPKNNLSIARSYQINKDNYVKKHHE